MQLIDILAIITFLILLAAAIFMLWEFYVCDRQNCKAFNVANDKGTPGSKEFTLALLDELFNDGIWSIPYIGAAILTPISLWFLGFPVTVRNFAILFFVSFATIYFLFAFFGHHYLRVIADTVSEYIQENCNNITATQVPIDAETDNAEIDNAEIDNAKAQDPVDFICHQDDEIQISAEIDNDETICHKSSEIFEPFIDGIDLTFLYPLNIF